MNISFQYPSWFVLICLLLGACYAFGLYWREKHFKEAGESFRKWYIILASLRFILVSLLALLLLSPLIKRATTRTEKPIIVLAQDNSESVKINWSKKDSADYRNAWNNLIDKLSSNYEVKNYTFGNALKENGEANYTEKTTNISSAFDELSNLYSNQNLGAIILSSDGIFNQGSSPVYSQYAANVPVYTLALGDTTIKRDLKIARVYFNSVAYLGNSFTIRTDIGANFCNAENFVFKLEKIDDANSKVVAQKNFSITSNSFETSDEEIVSADKIGVQHFRLSVSQLKDEVTFINNTKDIFIEVLDAKEKILLLANSPHPDLAAMKQSIETNKNYEANVKFANTFSGNVKDYSLVILHNLPSQNNSVANVLQQISAQHKPVLFVLGSQTNLIQFNTLQTMLKLNGINQGSTNDVLPSPSKDFSAFVIPDELTSIVSKLPPLQVPYANDYKTSPNANILFNQKIGNVTTNFPLILFQQTLDGKQGIICGEGLWRWRIYNYMLNQNHDAFDALLTKTVQYLAVKPDSRQFRVWLEKNSNGAGTQLFNENESIVFGAELLNDALEKITAPDVTLKIKNSSGKEFPFTFNQNISGYSLNAGYFPVGNYSYEANTNYNNKPFSATGNFSVAPVQMEQLETRANHQMLFALSKKSGGNLFYPNQFDDLLKAIQKQETIKPVLYEQQTTDPVINLKWIFFVLLLFLSTEWFIRKWQGGY